ncbi:hypothetical protein [Nitrosophilus labii]|uniref:hypothetical protein n=1 Tax=Nitrosophilus labii TaxID=2706014 RepID=UPI0016572E37|nr:hypothetical protein [Nitrosophilus labii]
MSRNFLFSISVILFLFALFLYFKNYESKDELKMAQKRYFEVEKKVKKIVYLKKRLEDEKYLKSFIAKLQRIKKADLIKDKDEYIEIYFSNLEPRTLDRLLQKTVDSFIDIKELIIDNTQKKCSVKIGIAK